MLLVEIDVLGGVENLLQVGVNVLHDNENVAHLVNIGGGYDI